MLFIISRKGLFKLNNCLNYICSFFAAGQVTVRTLYVRGYLRVVLVLIITNQKVKVKLTTQTAQIDPQISRANFEDISFQKFSK